MKTTRALFACILGTVMLWAASSSANAFCSSIQYSAAGKSQSEAMTLANLQGQIDVRQLNKRHGNRIKFEPATSNCTGNGPVRCTIAQAYCVDDNPVRVPRAVVCTRGRLFNADKKTCECPNGTVWLKTPYPHCVGGARMRCEILRQKCNAGNQISCRNNRDNCVPYGL